MQCNWAAHENCNYVFITTQVSFSNIKVVIFEDGWVLTML